MTNDIVLYTLLIIFTYYCPNLVNYGHLLYSNVYPIMLHHTLMHYDSLQEDT